MHAPDLTRQPYRRPPMTRGTDPQRMNWLWRLICEVADVRPADVVEALHATQVPVDQSRARSWFVSDRDDNFFPISIAEVERNLRALLLLREALRENDELAAADPGEQTPDSTAHAEASSDNDLVADMSEAADDGFDSVDENTASVATDEA